MNSKKNKNQIKNFVDHMRFVCLIKKEQFLNKDDKKSSTELCDWL